LPDAFLILSLMGFTNIVKKRLTDDRGKIGEVIKIN
jgi:hypothetical protein